MARITILFSSLYIALGLAAFVGTGSMHVTALIPAFVGVLLLVCGVLAQRENLRKHAMHGAAMIALLGVLGTVSALFKIPALVGGTADRPIAVVAQLMMLALSAVFLALCIRSFIQARRERASEK